MLAIAAGVLTAAVVAVCAATGVMTSGTGPADNTSSLGLIAGQDEKDAPAPGKTEAGAGTSGVRTGTEGEQTGKAGAGAEAGGPAISEPDTASPQTGDPEAGNTDSGNTEPGNTERGTTDPGNAEPGATEPRTTKSGTTEAGRTEGNSESGETQAPPTPVAKLKAHPFPALANLIGRSAPGLQAEQLNTLAYAKGDMVPVVCQQEGPKAYGTTIWDRTADGLWVSDAYVQTGAPGFAPGIPRC